MEIPGDLLNVGAYYLNVIVVKDASTAILIHNNAVSFEVIEGQAMGNWFGHIPGAVRPKLKWKGEVIETDEVVKSADARC
jgi:lipopolysaccharide transport system ATP-binding protein